MNKMLLKVKLFITSLVSLGVFPVVALSLFDFGVLYATLTEVIWLIIYVELFFSTIGLISIVYDEKPLKKDQESEKPKDVSKTTLVVDSKLVTA